LKTRQIHKYLYRCDCACGIVESHMCDIKDVGDDHRINDNQDLERCKNKTCETESTNTEIQKF
jgi:hypothetical protein